MATANSTPVSSPRAGGDNINTRASRTPWTHMFRGGESEGIAATPSSPSASTTPRMVMLQAAGVDLAYSSTAAEEEISDNGSGSNGNAGKSPAWNKPSNGAVEMGGSVMGGADFWPALSESARASTKSSSDSLKGLSEGSSSSSVSQGTAVTLSSSQRTVSDNTTPSHHMPARQRSIKRNGTTSGTPQPPGSQPPVVDVHLHNSSSMDHAQRSSQSRTTNDHPQHRNSFRNRNNGPHSRGDGSHHPNYGGRRDQDRINQDWNANRNFNGRDAYMQPQRGVGRFMRHPPPPPPPPPPVTAPYIATGPVRPYGGHVLYPESGSHLYYLPAPPPETFRGLPFVTAQIPPVGVLFPPPDHPLSSKIVNQIDYYFSNENLVKDTYLRQNMDDQGWVPITLIAGFNKVSHLTDNIQLILDALKSSTVVEVQGEKVRRRNDWIRWIITPSISSPHSVGNSSHDMLTSHLQNISLEERTISYGNPRNQTDVGIGAQLSSNEGTAQISIQGGLDHSTSSRNSST